MPPATPGLKLRAENTQLRGIIADLQHMLEQGTGQGDVNWPERQKEYEALIEEKSEAIRNLHLKIKELEGLRQAPPATPKEEELLAMSQDLERDRCQFQQERRQFEEDLAQFKEDREHDRTNAKWKSKWPTNGPS